MILWVSIGTVVLFFGIFYGWYIAIIQRRNGAKEALSSIDVQLRKRHDLIPNILKIAKRYMKHEEELLMNITQQRAAATQEYRPDDPDAVQSHLAANAKLQGSMLKLFAVSENYPDLKASESLVNAQNTFTEVEGHIAAARRSYNASVSSLNNSVEIFPGSMIAAMAKAKVMPFFEETDSQVRAPVSADQYLE